MAYLVPGSCRGPDRPWLRVAARFLQVDHSARSSRSTRLRDRTTASVYAVDAGSQEVNMGQDPPGWYYVGNGRLRYKFGDFWTDQY